VAVSIQLHVQAALRWGTVKRTHWI